MKLSQCIAAMFVFSLVGCGGGNDDTSKPHNDHAGHESAPGKSIDMKLMFGEDYQPGDIGHAFGEIVALSTDGSFLTIDHGPIHGISMGAMTMEFFVLEEVDLSEIQAGDKVEFLVKKNDAGSYDVMAICDMGGAGEKCLNRVMGE